MKYEQKEKSAERRLERLKEALSKEEERLRKTINNIGWGTGMRCTKCTPSFRREDELKLKIEEVKAKLSELE